MDDKKQQHQERCHNENDDEEKAVSVEECTATDDKAQTFRKRRLSLTSRSTEDNDEEQTETLPVQKRHRKASDASSSSLGSASSNLRSRTLHSSELLGDDDDDHVESNQKVPIWQKRHTRHDCANDKSLPFPRDVVGTYSCHGVEPICCDDDDLAQQFSGGEKTTMAAKTNQDRGGVVYPYGKNSHTALFAVYDGHGQGGELVSQYSLHEVQHLLEKHPDFHSDIEKAFKETFLKVDASLKDESLIEPFYAGTTACVALLRNKKLVLSNAGDSRAVLARKNVDGGLKDKLTWKVIDLTEDQNPDLPAEQERIEKMGGYVSPPPEPGLSSRVWLDKEWSQIGLAMARSIGDHAVKPIGVIAEPVVSFHDVKANDSFLILATDGVWEFISSAEAVEIVADNLHKGATKACQILIEAAAAKWHDEEGDYRDDITALVIKLQNLWDSDGVESNKYHE